MDKLNDIIKILLEGKTDDPDILSDYLLQFTANMYFISKDATEAEVAYAKKWTEKRANYSSDRQCEMALKAEPEWIQMQNRRSAEKMAKEMVMSLKKKLQILSDKRMLG
jgi:hypothetical protein